LPQNRATFTKLGLATQKREWGKALRLQEGSEKSEGRGRKRPTKKGGAGGRGKSKGGKFSWQTLSKFSNAPKGGDRRGEGGHRRKIKELKNECTDEVAAPTLDEQYFPK